MEFQEAIVIRGPRRDLPDVYRVLHVNGTYHGFKSAAEANKAFPGAFDVHPDSDDELKA